MSPWPHKGMSRSPIAQLGAHRQPELAPVPAPQGSYLLELGANPVRNSTTSPCNASCVAPTYGTWRDLPADSRRVTASPTSGERPREQHASRRVDVRQ